jgi:hypothetical protein
VSAGFAVTSDSRLQALLLQPHRNTAVHRGVMDAAAPLLYAVEVADARIHCRHRQHCSLVEGLNPGLDQAAPSACHICCWGISLDQPVQSRVARWLDLLVQVRSHKTECCVTQQRRDVCVSAQVLRCCDLGCAPCSRSSSTSSRHSLSASAAYRAGRALVKLRGSACWRQVSTRIANTELPGMGEGVAQIHPQSPRSVGWQ